MNRKLPRRFIFTLREKTCPKWSIQSIFWNTLKYRWIRQVLSHEKID
ncbi:MAG: hypothetical protein AEth_00679, partial [Candidatus Argoarchaeum ethanivorans]